MAVETAVDRAIFVNADDFGVVAQYSQNEGVAVPITGIFDRQHLAVDTDHGAVSGLAVTFLCRADDLALLRMGKALQGDLLTIDGDRWRVVEPQSDGTGMVNLILQKA